MVLENAIVVRVCGEALQKKDYITKVFYGDDAIAEARAFLRDKLCEIEENFQKAFRCNTGLVMCHIDMEDGSCLRGYISDALADDSWIDVFMLHGGYSFDGGVNVEVAVLGDEYARALAHK